MATSLLQPLSIDCSMTTSLLQPLSIDCSMTTSLLQPLSIDCSLEYDLDMSRFPGWDDPLARAQPTLMLHLADCCPCNQQADSNPYPSSSEDELSSIFDDHFDQLCYENADFQQMLAMVSDDSSPHSCQTDGPSFVDFLCDSYVVPVLGPLSSASESSADLDFFLISPLSPLTKEPWQPTSSRKRKYSHDSDIQPAAKRQRHHDNDIFDELLATFTGSIPVAKDSDPDNEMRYSLIMASRD